MFTTRLAGVLALRAAELLATVAVVVVALPVWVLPRRPALAIARAYGWIAGACWPMGRRVCMINLRRAYGDTVTRRKARRLTWAIFGNLGVSIGEGLKFAKRMRRDQTGWEEAYVAEDSELERRIVDDPRPKILVTGHLGSWEVAGMLAGLRAGPRAAAVARRIDNPFLDAVVHRIRWLRDDQRIEKRGASTVAMRRLEAGDSIAMLLDENAGPRGLFVEFMGRPASTSKTAALLSLRSGAPIVLGAAVRRPGDPRPLYRLALIEPSREASDPVRALTEEVTRRWERWVLEDPLQWRWIHWRWRHRPDGTEETYRRRDLLECFATPAANVIRDSVTGDIR